MGRSKDAIRPEDLTPEAGREKYNQAFEILGIEPEFVHSADVQIVAEAAPVVKQMGQVYQTLNDDLRKMVQRGPIDIHHITGEARVLIDPAHRNVVSENAAQGGVVRIACRKSDFAPMKDATSFFGAQLRMREDNTQSWRKASWQDVLDICGLAGNGALKAYVLADEAPVHFSIYGNERVLLQEKHPHPNEKKWVWYLKSERLVSRLRHIADQKFATARYLPTTGFSEMRQWLSSAGILPILRAGRVDAESYAQLSSYDRKRLLEAGFVIDTAVGPQSTLTRKIKVAGGT